MKLHIVFVLTDGSIVTHERELKPSDSVSKAVAAAAKDRKVAPVVNRITKAIRILDGNVFVDDKAKILWLMGVTDVDPAEVSVGHLLTSSKSHGHTVRIH